MNQLLILLLHMEFHLMEEVGEERLLELQMKVVEQGK